MVCFREKVLDFEVYLGSVQKQVEIQVFLVLLAFLVNQVFQAHQEFPVSRVFQVHQESLGNWVLSHVFDLGQD